MIVDKEYQLPIKILCIYLIFTLVLYAIGPLDWVTYYPLLFWFLQFIYIVAVYLGWQTCITRTYMRDYEWDRVDDQRVLRRINPLIKVAFFVELINMFRKFMFSSFDFSGLIDRVFYGLTNMGASYNLYQEETAISSGSSIVGGSLFTTFNYLWDFIGYLIILLAIYYYKQLSKISKLFLIATCTVVILSYISIGTNIGVFRMILSLLIFAGLRILRGEKRIDREKWRRRKKWIVLAIVVSIVLCTVLFDFIMKSRSGILLWNSSSYNIGGIGLRRDSILLRFLPESWGMLLTAAASYLTQGYYGFSLCLRVPWNPTFGFGHSMAVEKILKEYVTDWAYVNTYQHRIQDFGWHEDIQWHTAYTWFANDFSFVGVIIVMVVFGVLFAMAYKDVINTNNPYAYIIFYFFVLEAFFIPCNNQLFQSTYVFFSFITCLICWLGTRGRVMITLRLRR